MTDDLVRLVTHDDHARGCEGRWYACSCGYETRIETGIREAAARIEALEAELIQARSDLHLVMLGTKEHDTFHAAKDARDRVHAALTDPRHD